jgi:hypothetical protein
MAGFFGIEYFHFDGSGGCDTCTSMTGNYDEKPARPHPNCDCPITTEHFFYLTPLDPGFETVYKEKNESPGSIYEKEYICVRRYVNDSDAMFKGGLKVSKTVTGEISISAEIEEIFGISGKYEETKTIEDTIEVELEPGEAVSVDLIGILKTVRFSAQRWYILYPAGGDPIEVYDTTISDQIEAVEGGEFRATNI